MNAQYQIIGAGLIGLATAYALLERGVKDVRIIEAGKGVALETSYANAGMVHASLSDPWNKPGIGRNMLGAMWGGNASLKISKGGVGDLLGWGREFLRHSSEKRHWQATKNNLNLANYSLAVNKQWRAKLNVLDDSYTRDGLLKIYRTEREFKAALVKATQMSEHGLDVQVCNQQDVVEKEPALAMISSHITGGLYYPNDFKADAYVFAKALEAEIIKRGGEFCFETKADHFLTNGTDVVGVVTNTGEYRALNTIVAMGAHSHVLLKKVGVNTHIRPIKGYSLSFPCSDDCSVMPSIPVVDDSLHVAITPFQNCIRIAGIAEIAGFDPRIDSNRLAPLVKMFETVYPEIANQTSLDEAEAWCGFRPVSADGCPVIGRTSMPGLSVNTGHAHMGWTFSAGAGSILADILTGSYNELSHKFCCR